MPKPKDLADRVAALHAELELPDTPADVTLGRIAALRASDPDGFDRLFGKKAGASRRSAPRPPVARTRPKDKCDPPAAVPDLDLPFSVESGVEWHTHASIHVITPRWYCRPKSLSDLRALVFVARRKNAHVRAFGSGHSYSDVALTEDFFVDTSDLDQQLPLPKLRAGTDAARLVHVEAGIKLHALNTLLDGQGRGQLNLGGYTGQSIIGAISTSTHGSGIDIGSLASTVASMVLVTEREVLRIERADGPTDPHGWQESNVTRLVQDDRIFDACVVGLGCMGLVYSVVLTVRPRYLLEEMRTLHTWSELKPLLKSGALFRDAKTGKPHRHVEFTVNPHKTKGDHTALLTVRNEFTGEACGKETQRNWVSALLTSSQLVQRTLIQTMNTFPLQVPGFFDTTLNSWASGRYVNVSNKVLSSDNPPDGFACENAMKMEGDRHIAALETIFDFAERQATARKKYLSMVAVRFVKASTAYMAPQYDAGGVPSCHYEVLTPTGLHGAVELFRGLTKLLVNKGARPHWGLEFGVVEGPAMVRAMYPRFDDWLAVRRELNPGGTFDSPFTDRLGISAK